MNCLPWEIHPGVVDTNGNGAGDINEISAVASNFGATAPVNWP